jgi:phage-related protein
MPRSVKEQITTDLKQVKETGQLRAERVREIVRSAVSQVTSELKAGSSEIRTVVKDAISAAIAGLREGGSEIKEDMTAAIEGVVEGVSSSRQQSIAKAQAEIRQLQAKLDAEEDELQKEVDSSLISIEEAGESASPSVKESLKSAIDALKESEEGTLLKKRYAQLQAQAAILRANLAARYAGRQDEIKDHLDDAKTWYEQTRTKAGVVEAEQQRSQLEAKLGEAGAATARRERRIRQILSELLQAAAEVLREKEPSGKVKSDSREQGRLPRAGGED